MTLAAIAVALWVTFISSMVVGLVITLASVLVRRRGSVLGARLLLTGPAGGLCAAALFILDTDLPVLMKLLFAAMFAITGAGVWVVMLRSRIAVREVRFS